MLLTFPAAEVRLCLLWAAGLYPHLPVHPALLLTVTLWPVGGSPLGSQHPSLVPHGGLCALAGLTLLSQLSQMPALPAVSHSPCADSTAHHLAALYICIYIYFPSPSCLNFCPIPQRVWGLDAASLLPGHLQDTILKCMLPRKAACAPHPTLQPFSPPSLQAPGSICSWECAGGIPRL